jgi:hypothetical protein
MKTCVWSLFIVRHVACAAARLLSTLDLEFHASAIDEPIVSRLRLEQGVNVVDKVGVLKLRGITLRRDTILTDQELFKVPGNIRAAHRAPLNRHGVRLRVVNVVRAQAALVVRRVRDGILKVRPERVLFRTVHRHLTRDGKLRLVPFTRSNVLERVQQLEILVVALVAELVARHAQHDEVVSVLFLQGVQLNKIPDGRASHRRHVVDEDNLTLVLGERKVRAFRRRVAGTTTEALEGKVINGRGGGVDAKRRGAAGRARGGGAGGERRARARRGDGGSLRQHGLGDEV